VRRSISLRAQVVGAELLRGVSFQQASGRCQASRSVRT
jgi:hypothetical protein